MIKEWILKLMDDLEEKAQQTETKSDDIAVRVLRGVIEAIVSILF